MGKIQLARPVVLPPPLIFGASDHHRPWAGVLSLNLDTYLRVVRDVCESLALNGFKRVLLVNGHGGNNAPNKVAATDVANRFAIRIDAYSYWNINREALVDLAPAEFGNLPGHAADFETSCMLAVDPDSVRPEFATLIQAAVGEMGATGEPVFKVAAPPALVSPTPPATPTRISARPSWRSPRRVSPGTSIASSPTGVFSPHPVLQTS